jgi:PAS domain S-box-containing protein
MQIHLDPLKSLENDIQVALGNLQVKRDSLRQERLHREIILDSVDEAILILDHTDTIKFVNHRFGTLFNTSRENWLDKHVNDFYVLISKLGQESIAGKFSEVFQQVTGNMTSLAHDFELEIISDTRKFLRVFTGPIKDTDNTYLGRVWKFEDISQEKELQQMKEEFISMASHQLRTPLTAIWGYLNMINDGNYGDLPSSLRKPLQAVWHSAKRMKELVNDLLDISRIESGKIKATVVDMDLIATIQDEVLGQKELAIQKRQELLILPTLPQLMIKSDPKLVREMVKNYLSNAIKYTPVGKRVEVTVEFVDTKHIKVAVKDQGIGIPKDQQSHLFEKFYRAANVQTDDYEGTGLGLYYVKACARVLGGNVGFESKENEGSCFWFTLPYRH